MSMATAVKKPIREADSDQCVAIRDIGWQGYCTLIRLRGERRMPRMVYLDGTVWLTSPTFPHERLKTRLDHYVTEVLVGLRMPYVPTASTTFRRRAKKGGVEGDQTYYIANEARIRGKDQIQLQTDPPPDLAIEAVQSHRAEKSIEVYRRLRVPEVWICDDAELVILVLQPNGQYAQSQASAIFPFLSAAEVYAWVQRPQTVPELEWIEDLRRWVRRTLKPRVRRQDQNTGKEQDPTP
jgi:Uma2 family endonuclease